MRIVTILLAVALIYMVIWRVQKHQEEKEHKKKVSPDGSKDRPSFLQNIKNVSAGVDVYRRMPEGNTLYVGTATGRLLSSNQFSAPNAVEVKTPAGNLVAVPFRDMVIGGVKIEKEQI